MEKKVRKELVGKVVSATNDKTISVLVETYKNTDCFKIGRAHV